MALELVRDMINFNQVVGEGQSQALVDRDLIVPDIKPDIERVLSIKGNVDITNLSVEQGKIAVEGVVGFEILYAASDEPQPIYSMNQSANFSHYIDVVGAMPRMEPEVKCRIEHMSFNRLNGRKLNVQCVLKLQGIVFDRVPVEVIKEVAGMPDIQLMRDSALTDDIIEQRNDQSTVKDTIVIPAHMPEVKDLVKYNAIIHNKDVKVEEGRVVVSGSIHTPVLYSSNDENVDVYKVENDTTFVHTIEIPGAMPEMDCYVDCRVEDVYGEIKENEEGEMREVDIEVTLNYDARVMERNEVPAIIDAYSPSKVIECETQKIATDLYFGRDSTQVVVKENLVLPEGLPQIEKIYDVVCKPDVTDYRIEEDSVVVEGVVGCDLVYCGRGEEKQVLGYSDEIPFKASMSIPGCKPDMKPQVDVNIESVDFTSVSNNQVEAKIMLNCCAKVYQKVVKDFIVNMKEIEGEMPIHKASITIYMVQPSDTLWKIAKRYFTTVEDIMKVNEIEDSGEITPGMKLIIPKRVNM